MSDHLPECHMRHGLAATAPCICPELSACEQRVRREYATYSNARKVGFTDGLTAARDAVNRMGRYGTDEMEPWDSAIGYALAAIDALRGDA